MSSRSTRTPPAARFPIAATAGLERQASPHLLEWLVSEPRPRTMVAITRDAEAALADLGMTAERVRHPSYGG